MKFAHISDTHLGFSQFGTKGRSDDVYDAFAQAIRISIEQRVDFLVIAGDIFHTPTPDGTAILHLAKSLLQLKNSKIPVFFILGEHDISHAMLDPVPFVYHMLDYAIHVGKKPAYYNDVMIAGVDKMRKGELDSRVEYLQELDAKAKLHYGPCILLVHQGISEAHKFASEIAASDLPKNFDYYAMGHIHERSEWNFDFLGGPLAYPGSIEVIGSEGVSDTKKGFYIVEITQQGAVPKWLPLQIRPQKIINASAQSLETQINEIVNDPKPHVKKPIVQLRISGKISPELVRTQLARLEGRTFHTSCRESSDEKKPDTLFSRPSDTESEMLRLASESLGSENLARVAIKDLLRPLAAGHLKEACSVIEQEYTKYKKETIS